jgi:DNA-binding LytR/AlgR family response regulator
MILRFRYKVGSDLYSIRTDEIAYLKNSKRTITLFAWNSDENAISAVHKFYSTINNALAQLPEHEFVRCERSHVVNLSIIKQMENDSITFVDKDNTQIPIGKTFKAETRKAYNKYLEGLG